MATTYPTYRDYKLTSLWDFGEKPCGHKQVYTKNLIWIPDSWGQGSTAAADFRAAFKDAHPIYDSSNHYCTFNPSKGAYKTGYTSTSFPGFSTFPTGSRRWYFPISPKVLTVNSRDYYFGIHVVSNAYTAASIFSVPAGSTYNMYFDDSNVNVNPLVSFDIIHKSTALIEYDPATLSTFLKASIKDIYIAGGNSATYQSLSISESTNYLTFIFVTLQGVYFARVYVPAGLTELVDTSQDEGYAPSEPTTDPYLPDGIDPSGSGGGTGTFSETGDTIGIPGLPALSAVDTGFITLFNPSAAQVKALAAYMWSSSFDLATFKNIVANPIDCILGLSIVPVNPPNAGSKVVTVGNIPTDVTLPYLSSQYVEVDCGTLNVQEFWGSYLDYSPYTKMSLYLPYIGIIPLDIDDVMNASIAVKYHVDVLSGACVAYVLCNGTQLYTYVGQCSSNVPITSNDFTNTVNGILGIAGSIGKLAADGGASAPTEAAGIAANAINALKPNIQKSGAMSGTGGLMGVQIPYLICQRPRQSVPASQNTFTGYPANITAKLSDLNGYTEVDSIHLDGLSATQEEQQEIMDLLTSGVII